MRTRILSTVFAASVVLVGLSTPSMAATAQPFQSCAEVYAAGLTEVTTSHPRWNPAIDRDKDDKACGPDEDNATSGNGWVQNPNANSADETAGSTQPSVAAADPTAPDRIESGLAAPTEDNTYLVAGGSALGLGLLAVGATVVARREGSSRA